MSKKRDWHRLNKSEEECDMELDLNNWVVRARKNKATPWEYRKSQNVKHAYMIAENIVYEQQKR